MTLHTGSRVYVDIEDGRTTVRVGGLVTAETVIDTSTGRRAYTVHWDDGDTTNEIAEDIDEATP